MDELDQVNGEMDDHDIDLSSSRGHIVQSLEGDV